VKTSKPKDIVLDGVDESRREFISKLVVGTAFATPLIASFSMDGALIGEAEAAGVGYYAPYCGDYSYSFTGRFRDEDVRFNATVIADALEGATVSVVLSFTPRNNFKSATLSINDTPVANNLQLGPNVITTDSIKAALPSSGNPCRYLIDLTNGGGRIDVTDFDNAVYSADLVAHG